MRKSFSDTDRVPTAPRLTGSSLAVIALMLSATATPAFAQAVAAEGAKGVAAPAQNAPTPDDAGQEIIVTGSRLGAGFTAPTPVTTIAAEQIKDRGLASVAELAYEIPQLRINQNIGRSSEPVGQNQIDLRALGTSRTLVLLDGRRLAATSPFGGIDSNIFPVALINNVEVVTGGASAAYGSDAVAGVVNFGLQKDFTGLKLDASYAISGYNDYKRPVISGAAGTSLMDDRLHISVAGDFYHNTGQTDQASRDWGKGSPILFANPTYTATNGQTKSYIAYDGRLVATTGGLIIGNNADTNSANGADVLRGIQFGTNGNPQSYNYGTIANSSFQLGGDGATIEDGGNLLPNITRYSGYGRISFDINENITAWTDLLYSRVVVTSDLAPNYDFANTALTIQRDNAFLPQSVRTIMTNNGISSFRLSRINLEDGASQNNSKTRALRFAAGLEGKFGDGWSWDAYFQRSDNHFYQESVNNRKQANWLAGVDSVISPITGQPVCRINANASTADDNPACVPINVFGAGSINQSALNWYLGTSWYDSRMTQSNGAFNVKGSPFATWAGDVHIALGAEIRHDTVVSTSDAVSQMVTNTTTGSRGGWRSINQQPFAGSVTVKEGYLEAAVPLARDMAFAQNLEVNGAVRYAHYSSSGGVTTWKLGINYSPVKDIRFRGTISRDIRAANLYELYAGPNQVINSVADPRAGAPSSAYNVKQLSGGNASLTPERALTKALGVVFQPSFIPGLNASIDYYKIRIDDAITTIPAANIVSGCYVKSITELCNLITVDTATNFITLIKSTYVNAQTVRTSGVDFELSYRRPFAAGTIGSRVLVNYVHDLSLTVLGNTTDYVGDLATDYSGQPRWKANFDLTYSGGPLRLGAYVRYIGGGKFRSTYIDGVDLPAAQNHVKGRTYLDLSASYKISKNIELYGKIDNVFDSDPPVLPNAIVQPSVANSQMYDKIGRYYVGGMRLRF
jgi:outer membrane receptor protein involved in Fe transport